MLPFLCFVREEKTVRQDNKVMEKIFKTYALLSGAQSWRTLICARAVYFQYSIFYYKEILAFSLHSLSQRLQFCNAARQSCIEIG